MVQPEDSDAGGHVEAGSDDDGRAADGVGSRNDGAAGGEDETDVRGDACIELPVSRDVQPPVRKAGAESVFE